MRFASSIALIIFAAPLQSASDLLPPNFTIGRNLQTDAVVRLAASALPAGLRLTLTSEDPARLLLSVTTSWIHQERWGASNSYQANATIPILYIRRVPLAITGGLTGEGKGENSAGGQRYGPREITRISTRVSDSFRH